MCVKEFMSKNLFAYQFVSWLMWYMQSNKEVILMNVKQSVKNIETSVYAMTTMVSIHGLAQDEK